jgi:transposase
MYSLTCRSVACLPDILCLPPQLRTQAKTINQLTGHPCCRQAAILIVVSHISELCRREGIAASMYYGWSKEFLEAGKRRLAGDTARAATSGEVKDLRREASVLKEGVADLTLENRLL